MTPIHPLKRDKKEKMIYLTFLEAVPIALIDRFFFQYFSFDIDKNKITVLPFYPYPLRTSLIPSSIKHKSANFHNPEYCSGSGEACLGLDDTGDLGPSAFFFCFFLSSAVLSL